MPERKNLKAFVAAHEFNVAMFSVECIMSALIIIGGSIAVNLYIGIDVLSVTASVIAFVLFVISFVLIIKRDRQSMSLIECLMLNAFAFSFGICCVRILYGEDIYNLALFITGCSYIISIIISVLLIIRRCKTDYYTNNKTNAVDLALAPGLGALGYIIGRIISTTFNHSDMLRLFFAVTAMTMFGYYGTVSLVRHIVTRKYHLEDAIRTNDIYI